MNALSNTPAMLSMQVKQSNLTVLPNISPDYFLQGVLEGFIDGILILTEQGELVHANQNAQWICEQISQFESEKKVVPPEIWRLCESLIENSDLFPNQKMVIETELTKGRSINLRVRARWLKLEQIRRPCLLITLEDKQQSLQRAVNNDIYLYNLTPREAEVWLLYKANYSYKEIGDKLYITINTVKKHMKNIHAKRKSLCEEEI